MVSLYIRVESIVGPYRLLFRFLNSQNNRLGPNLFECVILILEVKNSRIGSQTCLVVLSWFVNLVLSLVCVKTGRI
jgi:hypothetical protein